MIISAINVKIPVPRSQQNNNDPIKNVLNPRLSRSLAKDTVSFGDGGLALAYTVIDGLITANHYKNQIIGSGEARSLHKSVEALLNCPSEKNIMYAVRGLLMIPPGMRKIGWFSSRDFTDLKEKAFKNIHILKDDTNEKRELKSVFIRSFVFNESNDIRPCTEKYNERLKIVIKCPDEYFTYRLMKMDIINQNLFNQKVYNGVEEYRLSLAIAAKLFISLNDIHYASFKQEVRKEIIERGLPYNEHLKGVQEQYQIVDLFNNYVSKKILDKNARIEDVDIRFHQDVIEQMHCDDMKSDLDSQCGRYDSSGGC